MNRRLAIQAKTQETATENTSTGILQRKCSCGQHTDGGKCAACGRKKQMLQRQATRQATPASVPPTVYEVLRSPGEPLDAATRTFFESRFGHDFSQVRIHTDARAAASTRAVNALAYTVGRNIVFGSGQYTPDSGTGRQLLAHELTHVVQQHGTRQSRPLDGLKLDSPGSSAEREARAISTEPAAGGSNPAVKAQTSPNTPILSRADPDAVSRVGALGRTIGTGIQFFPTNLTDTVVGPVSVRGGLLSSGSSRLNVIIGENLTPRILARQLRPLWTTATPFTPPGGGAPVPLDIIDDETLAKGLLVYNQYYLPVPAMTKWQSGLRFPLPVEIDETTGVGTLHPILIRNMAAAFDPVWTPLLDSRAAATAAVPAATLAADVITFLGRETTAPGRGIHLGARAVTNALAELLFIQEVFRQLGAGGFDVALAFMDNLVNREIELLAAQRDGTAILAEIQTALGPAPAAVSAAQQASLDRANLMLGRVAGVAVVAPPIVTRTRPQKTVTVDTLKLVGSTHNPATHITVANAIYSQCNVRVVHGVNADDSAAAAPQTTTWLGGDTALDSSSACGRTTAEERRMYRGAAADYGLTASLRAFFVENSRASGYSFPPYCATGAANLVRGMAVINNSGSTDTLAHELGHILINSGSHRLAGSLMAGRPRPTLRLTDWQCNRIYNNA